MDLWNRFLRLFKAFAWCVSVICAIVNIYCYSYPALDTTHCSWSLRDQTGLSSSDSFRSRILGIPYLGDWYNRLVLHRADDPTDIHLLAFGDPQINGAWSSTGNRKRLDIYGNDYYLGHIYGVMKSRLKPAFVAVMGDLISCNWVSDDEYLNRTKRYSTRLFPRPEADDLECNGINGVNEYERLIKQGLSQGVFDNESFYAYRDVYNWQNDTSQPLFINTTGNHDIGYSGEVTYDNLYRWTKYNGKDNYWVEFDENTTHPWRIVVMDSVLLDGPVLHDPLYEAQWKFVNVLRRRQFDGSTILITHIPFNKPAGMCADSPSTIFFAKDNCPEWDWYKLGNVKSQSLVSENSTQAVLDAVFSNGKPGIILTGHDHDGCVSYYNYEEGRWIASTKPGNGRYVQEVTVRSMMGEYGGNTGIVTGHFNNGSQSWRFDYSLCPFMVQHIWWASKVLLIVTVLLDSVCAFM